MVGRALILLSTVALSASGFQTSQPLLHVRTPALVKTPLWTASSTSTDNTVTAPPAPVPVDNSMVETPAATVQILAEKGAAGTKMSTAKTLTGSIMGGMYVGVGGMLSLAVSGNMGGIGAANPGLVKFAFAALFPVALFLCLQAGASLFTGNTATMGLAVCEKKITYRDMLRAWGLSYVGNLIGCSLFAVLCSYCGVLAGGAGIMAKGMLTAKTSVAFGPLLVKAILCNWLVCMAVFLATQAKDVTGKYIGIFLPISAFVSIGFEHSVANMFLLPAGLLAAKGAVGVSVLKALVRNLIPVTIGNAIAGAGIVGAGMSWQFGKLGEGK